MSAKRDLTSPFTPFLEEILGRNKLCPSWRLGSMGFGRPCIHLSLASMPFLSQELRHPCQGIMMWGVWVESGTGNPIRIPIYSLFPAISLAALEPLFHPPCLTFPLDTSSLTSFLAFELAFKRPCLASCTPAHGPHAGRPRFKVERTSRLIPLGTNPFSQLTQRLWARSVQCSGTGSWHSLMGNGQGLENLWNLLSTRRLVLESRFDRCRPFTIEMQGYYMVMHTGW